MSRKRVGVLISGRGSNMRALIEAARDPAYPAEIVHVVSNKADAPGLAYAASQGITTQVMDHRDHASREAYDAALSQHLKSKQLDIICCAGFMRILTPVLINDWAGRMLNIHPSLLPLYKGLHTHERALADGAKEHGASVHIVTEELDGGPVVEQAVVPVLPGDTPETLAARVLEVEHPLYVKALAKLATSL
ncbi:MAG: phosphoribosylglycinamide formyltransferase [Rhizobiales bacterium]|nr:phosphoribosylglycinamide formyltransferase [Hyphomicrobiales bacterium]